MRLRRTVVPAALAMLAVLVTAGPAGAHPLGNFTTNVAARLDVGADRVTVDYVVDLAEIPTLQTTQREDPAAPGWAAAECATLARGLTLTAGGQPLPLTPGAATAALPTGEAGLPTLRLSCGLTSARFEPGLALELTFHDGNFADRIGWREVTAVGSGAELVAADVPAQSISDGLRAYPEDRLSSPLDQRSAALSVRPGRGSGQVADDGASGPLPRSDDRLTRAFTSLVAERHLTVPFGVAAVAFALLLGAVHALAPGHGKTVMAAYLVGRDGDRRLAALLGLTVASTHTVAVLALGTVVSASEAVAPERAYPLLGVVSGLLFASLGAGLLVRSLRRHARHHHHDHDHEHEAPGWRGIVAPGLAGGLVPSPSALLVYLAGLTLGRAWFGIALVVTYGLGIAATLVGAGYVLVRARDRLVHAGRQRGLARLERVAAVLPTVTAVLVTGGGVWIALRAAEAA